MAYIFFLLTKLNQKNTAANTNLSGGGIDGNSKQQKEQAAQQQANAQAQAIMSERIKNTLNLLSNGFNKLNASSSGVAGGKFNLVKGAASSIAANMTANSNNNSNSSNIGKKIIQITAHMVLGESQK